MVATRLAKDKKSHSGSAQKSCFGMNSVFPFKKNWRQLGLVEESVLSSAE